MKETYFPTLEEALLLHNILIDRFSGSHGVLDLGLLESALARPRSGYYPTLASQAAALIQSLAKNHAFADGNKRIAFALTASFLFLNKFKLVCSANDGEEFMLRLAGSTTPLSIDEIASWLENRMKRIG